ESDGFTADCVIAPKLFAPQSIADHRRGYNSRLIIGGGKESSTLRFDAEYLKEIPVHASPRHSYRRFYAGQIEAGMEKARRIVERMRAITPVKVIGIRHARPVIRLGPRRRQDDQPLRRGIWQRSQQDSIGYTEDSRICADTQRQRDDRDQGK